MQQAQAQQYRDQAQLRDAQLNYQRFKDLLNESGAMSQQQVDTQKAQADQLEGAVRADQAAINNAQLQITYSRITSPINGRIGLRLVDPGNIVHATDQNGLFVITQLHPIAVVFTLPEDSLPSVAQRMKQGALEVDAYARDNQNKLATGKLQTIDNQIDQQTGTGKLKAVFENVDGVLWPNQFVNVRLLLNTRKGSVVVPSAAVQRGPQGTFVYLVKPDKTVEVRPVTVALAQGNESAIAGGLQAGDQVVTDGQDKLQPGMTVAPQARSNANAPQAPDCSSHHMSPSRLFILRPVATSLLMAAVLLVGFVAYRQLPVSALPEVDYPTVQVMTFYPGAAPDVMASSVTAPLERQFGQVPGLAQMTSTSSQGSSLDHAAIRARPEH